LDQDDRDVGEIYGVVLHQLTGVDSSFEPGFLQRLLVVDHPVPLAGGPETGLSPPFPSGVRQALQSSVDLPVQFISDESTRGGLDAARVGLGSIRRSDDRVAVDAQLYVGDLGATSATYVLEKTERDWQIIGRSGGAVA
jgi:hypothetical protein